MEVEAIIEELSAQIENENEETEGSEQIDSDTNDNDNESSGNGKTSKRKNHRGKKNKGSKANNKIEGSEAAKAGDRAAKSMEDVKHASTVAGAASIAKHAPKLSVSLSKKNTADLVASLLRSMASNLLKEFLAGIAKPPNSSLWKAFTQSPLYNPSGSTPVLSAMFASLQKPGHTAVLGAPTSIWAGDEYLKPEGRRDPKTGVYRSAWPELSELKAEGQYRKEASKDRRLPLPRKDV